MSSSRKAAFAVLACALASGFVSAQEVPLHNWTVPPYHGHSSSGGLTTMTDISPGVGFTAMQPCRIVDTRGGGVYTGAYGPPIMAAGQTRAFDINSAPHCPGIPVGVEAYSLNFTVTQTAGAPGDIRVSPTSGPPPPTGQPTLVPPLEQPTSLLNWTVGNATVANATIVPAGIDGSIDVLVVGTATHLLIDVNGYFTDEQNPEQFFQASGSRNGPIILAENGSSADNAEAVRGIISSTTPGFGSVAVRGINSGTVNAGIGIWGSHAGKGIGVYGSSLSGTGVWGDSHASFPGSPSFGVVGRSSSGEMGSSGVFGSTLNFVGATFGVTGFSRSESDNSAGVLGVAEFTPHTAAISFAKSGLRGESANGGSGAMGISDTAGVVGFLMNLSTDTLLAEGRLGTTFGTDPDGGGPPWGVHAVGAIGATGFKAFLDPHPTDPTKVIQYIALEGPEAGTYFRGRAKFQRGLATIAVPEDFRMVTDSEGLTVQITPIGEMASFAVVQMNLERILVKASRDVEFSYLVQGVRASFKEVQQVIRDGTFIPRSPEDKLPTALAERQKRLLIANGTYKENGTVNMETARRLGWDKMWEKRAASPQPITP